METRKIGSLTVPLVGLGCNNFGMRIDEAATKLVVDAAIDAGANFLDTADIYGGTKSEQFLGRVLQGRRDKVILATKFGHKLDEEHKGAHPTYVKQACEDSLQRLQTDVIDLYQLHTPDDTVPIADTLGALDELVKAGKVREIGCSNFSVAQLQEAEKAATGAKFASVQNEFSMLKRDPITTGVLEECGRQGLAFLPYFPIASGLLSGKYRKGQALPEGTRINAESRWYTEANLELVERLAQFGEARKHTLLQLSMSWLASFPSVASIITGATKPEQVGANVDAVTWNLNEVELAEIAALLC
jgi:aryl-alcohol dehydrogenase-like predicted oxidoreductase